MLHVCFSVTLKCYGIVNVYIYMYLFFFRFYKNTSSRRFVSEREDIVLLRMAYLLKIRKFRQQGRHIVYIDEYLVEH